MASMLFKIYLTNRTHLYVCQTIPLDGKIALVQDFRDALSTGLLEVLDKDGSLDLIPTCNIMHIECEPLEDEDDDEYDLERLFDEDEDEDDELDDEDELDEDDE